MGQRRALGDVGIPAAEALGRGTLSAYATEHREHGETFTHASLGLADMDCVTWPGQIERSVTVGYGRWGRSLVGPCLDEGRLVGLVSMRYELPRDLGEVLGAHRVRGAPRERRRGNGTKILRHAPDARRDRGLLQVALGCFTDNLAPAATVRAAAASSSARATATSRDGPAAPT